MRVYQAVNVVVHVFTVVISVLCGCLYLKKQTVCVLAAVPPGGHFSVRECSGFWLLVGPDCSLLPTLQFV